MYTSCTVGGGGRGGQWSRETLIWELRAEDLLYERNTPQPEVRYQPPLHLHATVTGFPSAESQGAVEPDHPGSCLSPYWPCAVLGISVPWFPYRMGTEASPTPQNHCEDQWSHSQDIYIPLGGHRLCSINVHHYYLMLLLRKERRK